MRFDSKEMVKSKDALRRKLADRPIGEKLRLAEELSERGLAIRPDDSPSPPDAPWAIPSHWKWKKMGEMSTVVGGSTPPTDHDEYFGGDIPWITPADLSKYTAKTISRGARNITQAGLDNSGARMLPAGTVLFSSRAPIGYVAIAANAVSTNQGFKSFILNEEVRPDFVYYYLQRARDLARSLASGTTFLEISGKKAAQIPIPVPPLDEQQRIVAEIEKQFTRLDAGVASLKRVQTALKCYRASVLKAACEGHLVPTEAELARQESRNYESGEQLLRRILKERRETWSRKEKYKEPIPPAADECRRLPEGWTSASAAQLTSVITDGEHITPQRSQSGVLLLSARNILNGQLSLDDVDHVPQSEYDRIARRIVIEPGDVLLSCSGTVGRSTVAPENLRFTLVRSVAVLKPLERMGEYLSFALRSPNVQQQIFTKKTQTAQANIFQGKIKTLSIPLPPLAEQARIITEVERRLSVLEELESAVYTSLQRSARLRQAILHGAFAARL
jgi:type I restriction enzyme, S subunit